MTALFGAYFGIYVVLGVPALTGLAFGTVIGLFVIRGWMRRDVPRTFECFLERNFRDEDGHLLALIVAMTQCSYAASELVILRGISSAVLGLSPSHATIFATAAGIIGYFYVLFGGYMAIYRTDILQFSLIFIMAIAFGTILIVAGNLDMQNVSLWPRSGYWDMPFSPPLPERVQYIYHFVIGAIMGFGLLAAAPDAWKRVFVVASLRRKTTTRFILFVLVGVAPFFLLLPLSSVTPRIPDGPIMVQQILAGLTTNTVLFVSISLVLIACFLSAFNSALLASVHVGLILRRHQQSVRSELPRMHWLMATALVVLFLIFLGLSSFENPYLLGNLLLGPYAIIAGIQAGTRAVPASLPKGSVAWIFVLGFTIWILYFASTIGLPAIPTTYEINSIPGGVLIFIVITMVCRSLVWLRGQNV